MIVPGAKRFVYIDHANNLEDLVRPWDAWVGQCRVCRGVHILRQTAWPVCSNPACVGAPGGFSCEVHAIRGHKHDLYLAAFAIGGPTAVIDILNAQEQSP